MKTTGNEELLHKDLLNSENLKLLILLNQNGINSIDELVDRVAEKVTELLNGISKNESEFYTAKEICGIYKISSATLERWIRRGLKYESSGTKCKRLFTRKNVEIFKTKIR